MILASETKSLLDHCVAVDGGNAYRANLKRVLPHIEDIYGQEGGGFRSHLGASLIGKECGRELWYGFRWFKRSEFGGRLLRLFNRGHMEEARLIALLLTGGIQVFQQDAEGHQFRISACGGHFGGSGDGIALGIPDIPTGQYCLLEFKTHSEKSFRDLASKGVQVAKPEHFIQMQMYLNKMNLHYALYIGVNKNTDELHCEIVVKDVNISTQFEDRASKIIFANSAPAKINEKSSWYQCKFCDYHSICHSNSTPELNCRTCVYSTPELDGTWSCRTLGKTLTKEDQLKGCQYYVRIK